MGPLARWQVGGCQKLRPSSSGLEGGSEAHAGEAQSFGASSAQASACPSAPVTPSPAVPPVGPSEVPYRCQAHLRHPFLPGCPSPCPAPPALGLPASPSSVTEVQRPQGSFLGAALRAPSECAVGVLTAAPSSAGLRRSGAMASGGCRSTLPATLCCAWNTAPPTPRTGGECRRPCPLIPWSTCFQSQT